MKAKEMAEGLKAALQPVFEKYHLRIMGGQAPWAPAVDEVTVDLVEGSSYGHIDSNKGKRRCQIRIFGGFPYEWLHGEDSPDTLSVEYIWAGIGKPMKGIEERRFKSSSGLFDTSSRCARYSPHRKINTNLRTKV